MLLLLDQLGGIWKITTRVDPARTDGPGGHAFLRRRRERQLPPRPGSPGRRSTSADRIVDLVHAMAAE
jgi:hypothetical protein